MPGSPPRTTRASTAQGDYVVLFNSDAALFDDALSRCADWLDAHPDVGASSPKLIGADGVPQQCVYPFPRVSDAYREALRLSPRQPEGEGWIAGTALVIRRAALAAIGGRLDDGFWMYWEDCDLSARFRAAGWRVSAFEGSTIRHHGGASGGGLDSNRRADLHAWYVHGRHRWFAKHRPRSEAAALWLLDAVDVARKSVRGTLHPSRRGERVHARVLARVLCDRLFGRAPKCRAAAEEVEPQSRRGVIPARLRCAPT